MRSAPQTCMTGPSSVENSIDPNFTHESPRGFGRNGDLVANTPMEVLPPSLGGRTVGCHDEVDRLAENSHISHI